MTIIPATLATDLAHRAALDWVDAIVASQQRAPRPDMMPKIAADLAVARHRRTPAA